MQSIGSNPELILSRIDDEDGGPAGNNRSSQGSLRDRFKALRMREEAGITISDETAGEAGLGIMSPESTVEREAVTSPGLVRSSPPSRQALRLVSPPGLLLKRQSLLIGTCGSQWSMKALL
jgi:hypothetical protein